MFGERSTTARLASPAQRLRISPDRVAQLTLHRPPRPSQSTRATMRRRAAAEPAGANKTTRRGRDHPSCEQSQNLGPGARERSRRRDRRVAGGRAGRACRSARARRSREPGRVSVVSQTSGSRSFTRHDCAWPSLARQAPRGRRSRSRSTGCCAGAVELGGATTHAAPPDRRPGSFTTGGAGRAG